MPATITAIIPTYNRATMLAECVNSIRAQTRQVDDIIIWDDGSTDNTAQVAQELGASVVLPESHEQSAPFRYYKSDNGGKSRALNKALQEARGDYIWICDDDDIGLPDAMAVLAGHLDADADLVAAGGSYRRFSDDAATGERVEVGPGYWPDLSHGSAVRHLLEDIFLFQNATLVRRSAYDTVGPFREDLARSIDYDMVARLACAGPIKLLDDPMFLQRKHDGDRGPAAARHAAAKSDEAWKAADITVFAPFRDAIPLALYEAMYAGDDPALVARAGLLQRACVYARRTDWQNALADFQAAVAQAPHVPLTAPEAAICKRAMAGKHGCAEAYAPDVRRALVALGRDVAGAGIAAGLARGVAWRLKVAAKAKQVGQAAQIGQFAAAMFRAGRRAGAPGAGLVENDVLPAGAYSVIKS